MLEPSSVAIIASSPFLLKLLGPTADYLGVEAKNLVEKRINNIKNVFSYAAKKLGDKIEEDGTVPPRVLRNVLNEASFCEEQLSAEYFGGVLASSRSGISRDDRGTSYMALLSRMSSYQIRAHYIFYTIVKALYDGTKFNPGIDDDRKNMRFYIPINVFKSAMEINKDENLNLIVENVIYGLRREQLIGDFYAIGHSESMPKYFGNKEGGIITEPSGLGINLYLWAHGRSDLSMTSYISKDIKFETINKITISEGYKKHS